jgi:hypothetical protein
MDEVHILMELRSFYSALIVEFVQEILLKNMTQRYKISIKKQVEVDYQQYMLEISLP